MKNGEIQPKHSSLSYPSSPSSSSPSSITKSNSSSHGEYELIPKKGDLLVVRKIFGYVYKDIGDSQSENIFHSRFFINNKFCILIIDGESCTNVASKSLMGKLNLPTTPHPRPYKIQWLSENGEIKVTDKVLLSFSIGKYKDVILCDVVPIEACHVLLGRPWQYDRHIYHDDLTNKFSFEK